MKLGLVIKITNGGVSEAYSINKSEEWSRYAEDVRPAINSLSNFDGTGNSVLYARFLGAKGYLLCIIKARPEGSGRGGDNVAAWIYIPSGCDLGGIETTSLLQKVETAIAAARGIDEGYLTTLFSADYNARDVLMPATKTLVSNNIKGYALRYYNNGEYNLKELLGVALAQKEYSSYNGVFFVDKQTGITIQGDVLDFEPENICTYFPPSPVDGFMPCFPFQDKYQSFNKAIEVPSGSQVTIFWIKNGYAVIQKSFIAKDGPQCPKTAMINPSDYKVIIRKKMFYVTAPSGVPINQFDVRINHQLMEGEAMEVSESIYQNGLTISIYSSGYAEKKLMGVHPQLDRTLSVQLSKQTYHYEFAIPVYDGDIDTKNDATLILETHRKISSSPIKGYTTYGDRIQEGEGHLNRLFVDNRWLTKLKYMAYGFASCVLVLLLYAGCSALENYEFQFDWPPFKKVSQQHTEKWNNNDNNQDEVGTDNVPVDSLALVINYLNNNEIWNKDSLETYPATRELFDDLNDFHSSNVDSKYNPQLRTSSRFEQVRKALIDNFNKGYNPRIGKEANDGKYNPANDKKISVPNYIDWLSKDHSKDIPKQEQPTAPSRITEGSKKVTPQVGNEKPELPKNNGRKIN